MARFLFAVLPTRGHIYPCLPIAYVLRDLGHQVGMVTLPEVAHLLTERGVDFIPLHPQQEGTAGVLRPSRRDEQYGREMMKEGFRRAFITPLPAAIAAIDRAVESYKPDVLVNDYVFFAPLIVAERRGLPIATISQTVASWPGHDLGPFGPGLPPASDEGTRAYYATLRSRGEEFFSDIIAELNEVRATNGLPARPGPLAAATLSPYLHLILTTREFDYRRHDLPPQMHYVGPVLFDPPSPPDAETAAWLAALPVEQPLALVSASGAFMRSAALVEMALSTLAGPDLAVLATLPFDHPLHDGPPQPHGRLARFVSHSQVLPRAQLVLTHGGFGTVTKALCAGLPLLVVPYAADQPEVAQRVVASGAGLRLDPADLSVERLREAVSRLQTATMRETAARLAANLTAQDGPTTAASLLTRLARTGEPILNTDDVMKES